MRLHSVTSLNRVSERKLSPVGDVDNLIVHDASARHRLVVEGDAQLSTSILGEEG